MSEAVDPVWFILDKIQKDIDRMDEKQDEHLIASTKLSHQLDTMAVKVGELNKLLTVDNGKPSVVSQLSNVSNQIDTTAKAVTETKELVAKLTTEVSAVQTQLGMKTPKEVRAERWKAVGLIGGGFLATVPGILAFIHSLM